MESSNINNQPTRRDAANKDEIAQRRKSLPAHAANGSRKSSERHGNVPPASPEVISNLISSFSTITPTSTPTTADFPRTGYHTAPNSPTAQQTDANARNVGSTATTTREFVRIVSGEEGSHEYLHPDDAAMSPVIRMSKPSSRSQKSHRSSYHGPGCASPKRPMSRASYGSLKNEGGLSDLDPRSRLSTTSFSSTFSEGRRKSMKGKFNLLHRSSHESLNESETGDSNQAGVGDGTRRNLRNSTSRHSLPPIQSMVNIMETVDDNLDRPRTTKPTEFRRVSEMSSRSPRSPGEQQSPITPNDVQSGKVIPTRESSLRHLRATSPAVNSRKRHSARFGSERRPGVPASEDKENKEDANKVKDVQGHAKNGTNSKDEHPIPQSYSVKVTRRVSEKKPTSAQKRQQEQLNTSSFLEEPSGRIHRGAIDDANMEESAPSPTIVTHKRLSAGKRSISPYPPTKSTTAEKRLSNKTDRYSTVSKSSRTHARTQSDTSRLGRSSVDVDGTRNVDPVDLAVNAYLAAPRLTQKVSHPQTGRLIAFSEVGNPQGHVVICCVGMGLTRYLTAFYDELARTLNLRLITLDRPGVGASDPCLDGTGTPLGWPDDLAIVCNYLKITKFFLLAHSAGAIYALATALRMPQHIRGRIHLLAPWIPPSQMSGMGSHKDPLPSNAVPYSQRILRALPTSILKVANSSFMTATSASITSNRSPRRNKHRGMTIGQEIIPPRDIADHERTSSTVKRSNSFRLSHEMGVYSPFNRSSNIESLISQSSPEQQSDYDERQTHAIWEMSTKGANPAIDLLTCLERRQTIGFRYVDINRAIVIHHGSRDTRVPVDNVRWLGKTMRRCEVRVLEGEGHGLMASAAVMSNVLMEIAKEWEDWTTVVQGRRERNSSSATVV